MDILTPTNVFSPFSPVKTGGLVGRDDELQALFEVFHDGRRHTALVVGERAMGITSLAHAFLAQNPKLFSGGVAAIHAGAHSSSEWLAPHLSIAFKPNSLLFIDEADRMSRDSVEFLKTRLTSSDAPSLLLAAHKSPLNKGLMPLQIERTIRLKRLSPEDSARLFRAALRDKVVPPPLFGRLLGVANGSPREILMLAARISDGESPESLLGQASDFEILGVVGPDGQPIGTGNTQRLITNVTVLNNDLITKIKANPELMKELPPRKFEELVAALLEELGCEVQLTPESDDGGFDIFAAKQEPFGKFLYLVECKRWNEKNVGVTVVRALQGVVHSKRANAGIIATTSRFTKRAKEFQKENEYQMQLRDYMAIQDWLAKVRK